MSAQTAAPSRYPLDPQSERALAIYETRLKSDLERDFLGQTVAINPDSGEFAIGKTFSQAARSLSSRQPEGAPIVTMRIGPPTPGDVGVAQRILGLK